MVGNHYSYGTHPGSKRLSEVRQGGEGLQIWASLAYTETLLCAQIHQ